MTFLSRLLPARNKACVKIFVVYHDDQHPLYSSDIYQPILTAACKKPLYEGMIGDNTGDNISELNTNLGELTAHYWVWKNYLPTATEEYIGFCHYRRFLDPTARKKNELAVAPIHPKDFAPRFRKWNKRVLRAFLRNYDAILPPQLVFEKNCLLQYEEFHPMKDLVVSLDILRELYPDYAPYADEFFAGNRGHFCLSFIMRKEKLEEYFQWVFPIIDEMRKRLSWEGYQEYNDIRTPAYIVERFINVWLNRQIAEGGWRVKETRFWVIAP